MSSQPIIYRSATPEDALSISVLATQVFLDTYAAEGIRADLAREALSIYNVDELVATIAASPQQFSVADRNGHLVGFTEIERTTDVPFSSLAKGLKCKKLYIQRHFKRMGIGQQLLHNAERVAVEASASCLWLQAWIGNTMAIEFYHAVGYTDIGRMPYYFEGIAYENIVFCKNLPEDAQI